MVDTGSTRRHLGNRREVQRTKTDELIRRDEFFLILTSDGSDGKAICIVALNKGRRGRFEYFPFADNARADQVLEGLYGKVVRARRSQR